jgi:ribose 5-phosphate isomerase A
MSPVDQAKRAVGYAAVELLGDNMVVGLGTGSTADFFLMALGQRIREGKLRGVLGLPTSRRAEQRAREMGIPITTFSKSTRVHITIDGADEIDPRLNLIKGMGGALLREKIVAQNSDKLIVIADATKKVGKLGMHSPLPVEVAIFGHETQAAFLAGFGCEPVLRRNQQGEIFVTDNGNYIFDCRFKEIPDPAGLDRALGSRGGVVESGLFLGIAGEAMVATADGKIERLTKP